MKKGIRIALSIVVSLVFVFSVCLISPRGQNFEGKNVLMVEKGSKPILIAHGGGNKEFPDNTLEAFYNAFSVDSSVMMETDVSITKDGVVLLSHDTTLDRKTNISANIIDINYADLIRDKVDFNYSNPVSPSSNGTLSGERKIYKNYLGEQVLPTDVSYPAGIVARDNEKFLATTLEDLIKTFPNNAINVEIKQQGEVGLRALKATIKLMEDLDERYNTFARICLASFHKEIYSEIKNIKKTSHKNLMFSPEQSAVTKFVILNMIGLDIFFTDPVACFQLPMEQMGINLHTKRLIRNAHKHNIAVHYWTINDVEDMKLLCENGADGIMTDIPSRLKTVLAELYPA